MRCVLVLASGAPWESEALDRLRDTSGIVVLKRCVDTDDLMATATTGQAELAVVAADAPGLDGSTVTHLRRHGVAIVAVTGALVREDAEVRLARIGIRGVIGQAELADLPRTLLALAVEPESAGGRTPGSSGAAPLGAGPSDTGPGDVDHSPLVPEEAPQPGRITVVWGPVGAPGRTTLAAGIAGEVARRQRAALVVDADPWASLAQHLGVVDQVSGLLSASRAGGVDLEERLRAACRTVDDHLAVLTGLPRPERQVELREGVLEEILRAAAEHVEVVVDAGAELGPQPSRHLGDPATGMALEALGAADEIVVVGAADPVGLARLARSLVELREHLGEVPVRVVVNRMRPSLGWSRADVAGMVEGFARVSSLHFLPEDRPAADRALVAGRTVVQEVGSPLAAAIRELVDATHPQTYRSSERRPGGWSGLRRRRAGTTRQR